MGLALLIIFMFVAYGLTTLYRRWIDIPTLLAVAIGCAVNANIFHPYSAPIVVGPFTFSIEIVLYTLFMYTIIVRILDYSYEEEVFIIHHNIIFTNRLSYDDTRTDTHYIP